MAGRKDINQSFRLSGQHLDRLHALWCCFDTATNGTQQLRVRQGSLQKVPCFQCCAACVLALSACTSDALFVQKFDRGNRFFNIPPVSFSLLDVDLFNVPAAPPAVWFIQANATSADGGDVEVLLRYPAAEVPER